MPDLTIRYAHAWEQMVKGIDSQGPYYRVSYKFDNWSDSDKVANALRGYTVRTGNVTLRTPPHVHPLSTNLQCVDCVIEGLGNMIPNALGYPSYDGGFYAHCEYRAISMLVQGANDPDNNNQIDQTPGDAPVLWCTQELDYDVEAYVFDESNQYRWETSGKPTGVPIKITVGVTTLVLTFPQLPYLPMTLVRSKRNNVNSVKFLGAAVGTVWFRGARTVRELNTDGTICQKVQLTFQERDVDWRKYLKPDGTWDYIIDTGDARVLTASDLNPLIQL